MASRWDEMTVTELRKYAREHGITLSAGINKQGIVDRIAEYEGTQDQLSIGEPEQPAAAGTEEAAPKPVRRASIIADDDDESREIGYGMGGYTRPQTERPRFSSDPVRPQTNTTATHSSDVLSTISSKAPAFHIDSGTKAWHNPRSFQPNNYHAPAPQAPAAVHSPYAQRPADQSRPAAPARPYDTATRPAAPRPAAPQQRFGPAETPRAPEAAPAARTPEPAPVMDPNAMPEPQPRPASWQNARSTVPPASLRDYQSLGKPAVNELLNQDESEDAEGSCVLLNDGTAFLYPDDNLDDESVIYMTAAQVRRFQLRTGDQVTGKIRARREGDKYRFMLYVTGINGIPVDDVKSRASFDSLHVIVPAKRLCSFPLRNEAGEKGETASAPILYGQRVFAAAKDDTALKLAYAMVKHIQESKPNARVLLLSVQDTPEEAALVRASLRCPVMATEPAAPMDKQCQVIRLAAARAARIAEQKADAVLLISCPNTFEPSENALYEALLCAFSSGRLFKEGGSVTTILVSGEAADARFAKAASQQLTVMPDGSQDVLALDGSVNVRGFQIFV